MTPDHEPLWHALDPRGRDIFLRQLIEKLGKLPAPVAMPASSMGVAAARFALTPGAVGGVPEKHLPRVLLLPEGELENRETSDRIRALVEGQ